MLQLSELTKRFGAVAAVDSLDLAVAPGELVVLAGPSGCGKTTTLRLIAGLETPDRGTVFIDGRDATRTSPREREVAMCFQEGALYPHLNARENIAFPLRFGRRERSEIERRV
ncbi:MAG: ABC transporter ATP-binding protein, partial [Anaerolineae bacterium]|nr:ABC transporter ATP-binding protein [Anaerolineae bacterium]